MDKVSPEERSRMMSHVRSTDTQPEIKVRSFLHRSRLRFRLHCRNLPGSVSRWPRRSGSAGGHCQVLHVCGRHGDLMPFPRPSADVTCCSSRLLCLFVARRVEPFAAVTGPRLTPSRPGERVGQRLALFCLFRVLNIEPLTASTSHLFDLQRQTISLSAFKGGRVQSRPSRFCRA